MQTTRAIFDKFDFIFIPIIYFFEKALFFIVKFKFFLFHFEFLVPSKDHFSHSMPIFIFQSKFYDRFSFMTI
jgi:hypothetical protein